MCQLLSVIGALDGQTAAAAVDAEGGQPIAAQLRITTTGGGLWLLLEPAKHGRLRAELTVCGRGRQFTVIATGEIR